MNPSLRLPKDKVAALEPSDLEDYLRDRGWKPETDRSTPKVGAFRHAAEDGVEVLVPRDRQLGDYALRVGDVLQTLAVVERRTAWEVFEELWDRRQVAPPKNGPARVKFPGVS